MAKDFNIQRTIVPREIITGNRVPYTANPAVGNNIAVAYFEATPENFAAVNNLIVQAQALCVDSVKKIWLAEALPDKNPQVDIRVVVRNNVENT